MLYLALHTTNKYRKEFGSLVMGKKAKVLEGILARCEERGDYTFDNELVKKLSEKEGFKNPFDATKLDNASILPRVMREKDVFILHLGEGKHRFVKGIKHGYHEFEKIPEKCIATFKYKKSIINEFNTSESNILSVAYNQRVIHDFLYGNDRHTINSAKVYNAHRTKSSLEYSISGEKIRTKNLQIELDLTMETHGMITIFEAKNGFKTNFAVYQLFHPFAYYHQKLEDKNLLSSVKKITCCYLLREHSKIRMYEYTFDTAHDMGSISLIKAKQYNLIYE